MAYKMDFDSFNRIRNRAAAAVAALILFIGVSLSCHAAPSYENALPGVVKVGADIGPSLGNIRVPVVIIGEDAAPARLSHFFSNSLDGLTFRNYWRINSKGKYDARAIVIPIEKSVPSLKSSSGSDRQREAALKTLVTDALTAAIERGALDTDFFDSSGPARAPDGWMDGILVLAPGVGKPIIARASGEPGKKKPAVGPFAILDLKASPAEILAAFASLIGFVSVDSGPCLSVFDNRDDNIYMIDGYNRVRAGWADTVDISGPPRSVLIIPSDSGGSVYKIGKGKEYFLVEGRDSKGFMDSAILQPGVAVYHIDETSNAGNGRTRNGAPTVTIVAPSSAAACRPEEVLLFGNGILRSDYNDQNHADGSSIPSNLNWNSGEPSDAVIKNIDNVTHYPIITAEIGFE